MCVKTQNDKKNNDKRANIRNKEVLAGGRRPVFDATGVLQTCEWGFRRDHVIRGHGLRFRTAADDRRGAPPVDVCTPPLESRWRTRRCGPNDDHENVHVHPRDHRPGHALPTAVREYARPSPRGLTFRHPAPRLHGNRFCIVRGGGD